MIFLHHIIFIFLSLINGSLQQLSHNKDELLNWCLKGINHKYKPGREDSLHEECSPWKNHACCTKEVTIDTHQNNQYNFTLDHCYSQIKMNISSQCRKFFTRNNCFYECEPHIGLWVVETNRKIAKERFFEVPLCASDCKAWFSACKNDFTCAYNWPADFKFVKGRNICQDKAQCTTFRNMYNSAEEFCENVWDHSWKYTADDEPCMHLQFDEAEGNPNRRTAEFYIDQRFGTGRAAAAFLSVWIAVLSVAFGLSSHKVL